jgi:uncharacterized protein
MTAAAPRPASVRSPCTSVCRLNASTGWCEGCYRSIDEIAAWSTMSDPERLKVWRLLGPRRRQGVPPQEPDA